MAKRYGAYASRGEGPAPSPVPAPDAHEHRVTRVLYWIVQWTWGAVQNVVGAVIAGVLAVRDPRRRRFAYHGALVMEWDRRGASMALGMFIFFGHLGMEGADETLVHEYGHTVQSCILGPAYLLVIGLPSFLWATLPRARRGRRENGRSYFDFYTEKWANRCGEATLHASAPKR